jgi:ribosomal protein L27
MPLSSMVVSRDWQEVSVLECILGGLDIDVTVEREPQRALARLSKSSVDALIVDCDLNGSSQLLRQLPALEKQAKTCPLVLMGGPRQVHDLEDTGALFAFEKPISAEQAVRTLSAARNLIVDGRLRYDGAALEVLVSVKAKDNQMVQSTLVNVSQGGIQIHTDGGVEAGTLHISFALPSSKVQLNTEGEVAWKDQRGNIGIRFVKLSANEKRALQLWLAQQFLAN